MWRPLLESIPPQSAILIHVVVIELPLKKITESYKSHPSVATIKENVLPDSLSFDLPPASKEDINMIVKSLNANKAKFLKLIKLSANIVDKYVTSIINQTYLEKERPAKQGKLPSSEHLKWIFKSLWEVHKWQYAPYNTNLSLKLCCFSSQKTLQCKPCTYKSNRELEKEPRQ